VQHSANRTLRGRGLEGGVSPSGAGSQ
jgi:hypothetical protein